jgi:hypothetical protein
VQLENKVNATPPNFAIIQENLQKLVESNSRPEVICVYKILAKCQIISTNNIIKLALTPEFEKDCYMCSSAESVYRGIRILQDKGWVIGKVEKGGYVWQLITC